jgi:hypothetical protein
MDDRRRQVIEGLPNGAAEDPRRPGTHRTPEVLVLVLKEFLADSDDEPNCGTVVD